MQKKLYLLLFSALLLPAVLLGGTVGKIKGKITDQNSGEPLIGATVKIVGSSLGAVTDIKGEYQIQNLQPGNYTLKITFIGYQTVTFENIRVNVDLSTEANAKMPADGITTATINIVAERPLIDKSSTNATKITTSEDLKAIPVRGVNAALRLNPSVVQTNGDITIRGGRPDEVGNYLEGVSINNPMSGTRAITLIPEAIEEIQVQSGGYTAEFGNANAGITRQQFKSGTSTLKASIHYITDNISLKSASNAYDGKKRLGAYWYGYDELTGSLSGPAGADNIKFFILGNYQFARDQNFTAWPGMNLGKIWDKTTKDTIDFTLPAGPLAKNQFASYTGTGTLTFDFNPLIVRFAGTASTSTALNPNEATSRITGDILNMLNSRIQEEKSFNGAGTIKTTYIIDPNTCVEFNLGYFRTTFDAYDPILKDDFVHYGGIGDTITPFYQPTEKSIFQWNFNEPNTVVSGYRKNKRENFTIAGAFTYNYEKEHTIKIGGELNTYTIRNYSIGNEGVLGLAAAIDQYKAYENLPIYDSLITKVYKNRGVNNYGYDLFGKETDDNGLTGPKKPLFAALYIQDKIEYKDLILSIGFRYDYIDVKHNTLVDPRHPEYSINKSTAELIESGWKKTKPFNSVSPRFGLSFPVTDKTVFHTQFGKFIQQTRLADLYTGPYAFASNIRGGFFILTPFGLDLRPTKTTQYEIGFNQQVGEIASFDITGYYKDIKDQIVYEQQQVDQNSGYQSYMVLKNGDFATTKGVEISFNMKRVNKLKLDASLAFSDAQGTGSNPTANRGIVGAPLDGVTVFRPQYVSPLDFNTPVRGSVNMDYRFDDNEKIEYLKDFGLSALFTFNSGHPYTFGTGSAQSLEQDARSRQPLEALGASLTPAVFQLDVRIDKTFRFMDMLDMNVYIQVINLFDTRNVINVFAKSGVASDDGTLSNPEDYQKLVALNGINYAKLYKAINIDYQYDYNQGTGNNLYGTPRQIRFGIKIDY